MRGSRIRLAALPLTLLLAAGAVSAGDAMSEAGSLPEVTSGVRPGPDLLYEPLATAPEMTNVAPWEAEPLMVAGASAYTSGEFVYQDHVYDSYGANTTDVPFAAPDTVPHTSDQSVGAMTGDVVYPTDVARFGHDAADLLEFRARLDDGRARYRVTLNTMLDPSVAAVAIAIDSAPGGRTDWGHGIGSVGVFGIDHVVVVSSDGAWLDGSPLPEGSFGVDAVRHQLDVVTPLAPGDETWTHYAGVGLWDSAGQAFVAIGDEPTMTTPGGAHGTSPPPFFNVAFRSGETLSEDAASCTGTRAASSFGCGHFNEHAQAIALAARDISSFRARIDFGKLANGVEESHVPTSGFMTRLYVSRLDLGQGMQPVRPMLRGRIQPYGVYVPATYSASEPAPLHLQLHWLYGTWTQFAILSPNLYRELGDARGAIVVTPSGRGPDGWYHHDAEADVFEAWADAAARYSLDASRVTIGGYSMGGYGTMRLASRYPDLFAAGFAIVGPADESIPGGATGGRLSGFQPLRDADDAIGAPSWGRMTDDEHVIPALPSVRHVPLLLWVGANDANVPVSGGVEVHRRLSELGSPHELHVFPGYDHHMFHVVDEWGPAREFLDAAGAVDRDPAIVTHALVRSLQNPNPALGHDHAYWLSDMELASDVPRGTVTAVSYALPAKNKAVAPIERIDTAPTPNAVLGVDVEYSASAVANLIDVEAIGVSAFDVWLERAGIDPGVQMTFRVSTDRAATITLRSTEGDTVVTVPGAGTWTEVIG